MIFNNTELQSVALVVFLICGIIFGTLLWLILFVEKIFATKMIFNIALEGSYVIALFICLFLIEQFIFNFHLRVYHMLALFAIGGLSFYLLKKATSSHIESLERRALSLKSRLAKTKFFKFLKK